MSRGLSDDEASREMKKMVAFIMQEATEKAKEIRIKADEEFNIEKAKLVRQETTAIETNFARRLNQAVVKRKIAQSNQINKSRLNVLQCRDERLAEIIEDAQRSLPALRQDAQHYAELMTKLCLEVFFRLMETDVALACLPDDQQLVQDASTKAASTFEKATGLRLTLKVEPTLNEDWYQDTFICTLLHAHCSYGGVLGSCKGGRIRCSNTLKDRLANVSAVSLPGIREILFGVSQTRKHMD